MNRLYFLEQLLGSQQNGVAGTIFPIYPLPYTCTASSFTRILHQSGMFLIIHEPTETQPYHPKSLVHIRVHSSCCIYIPWVWTNGIYPPLQYHTEYFYCSKISCALPIGLFPPLLLATSDLLIVSVACFCHNVL